MERLKIAFVSAAHPSESAGGLAHTLAAICRPIARAGHEVTVFYPVRARDPPPAERWNDLDVVPVGWHRFGRLPFGPDLEFSWRVARRLPRDVDVVVAHGEHGGRFVMRATRAARRRRRARTPVAVHAFHGLSLRFLTMGRARRPDRRTAQWGYYADRAVLRWLEGGGARAADAVVPCSRAVGQELVAEYRVDPARVHVIYNGVDPQPEIGSAERADARRSLGLDDAVRTLAFIGQDTHRKGLDVAIGTIRRLGDGGRRVLLLNIGNDAPSEEGVRSFGVVAPAEKRRLLAAADVFLLPTRYEGLPAVVQEAAALRLPVATTDAAHVEWGTPGVDFLRLEPNTAEAAAAALGPLLDDADARRAMGERGFRTLGDRRYDDQAREYLQLFRRLIDGPSV